MSDTEKKQGLRKQRVGNVVSIKMDKTIVVEFIARVPHPKFKKIIKRTKKFYAHDENGEASPITYITHSHDPDGIQSRGCR